MFPIVQSEAMNTEEAFYGEDRLLAALARCAGRHTEGDRDARVDGRASVHCRGQTVRRHHGAGRALCGVSPLHIIQRPSARR
jgi:hypothetical protein